MPPGAGATPMDASDLAQRFNDASQALAERGHRVVVRRARVLLESGNAPAALAFLGRAHETIGAGDDILRQLEAQLRAWLDEGGEPSELTTEPDWVEGAAAE